MKPFAALWRLALSVAVAVVLMILIANVITQPAGEETRTYTAEFTDAAGLYEGGDVRVRGVQVGKVRDVRLSRRGSQNVAAVTFTLNKRYGVVDGTRIAVKYEALTGVRYLDVMRPAESYSEAELVTQVPTRMTQPSFDITALFNGLQPVLATLSPEEINVFTSNAAAFLSGDGSALQPLLESLRRLTQFLSNRQEVVATLMNNLSNLADAIGTKSEEFIHLLDLVNQPVDNALTVLDEFRKAMVYGVEFVEPVERLLQNAGFRRGIDIDKAMDRAFNNLDNFFDAFELVPAIWDNIPPPGLDGIPEPCTRGRLQLPETMEVLLNGSRVVLCNR